MPEIVAIFSCQSLRFSISLKYSASTEKSPQPGHHVGWSAASSFLVSGLRSPAGAGAGGTPLVVAGTFGRGISVAGALIIGRYVNVKWSCSKFAQTGGNIGFGAFEDFLHFPGEAVRFVDADDLRVAIARAKQGGQLAIAVKAFVVHFDH